MRVKSHTLSRTHTHTHMHHAHTRTQESCRIANLESYVHQADHVLRKCVSAILKGYTGWYKTLILIAKFMYILVSLRQ